MKFIRILGAVIGLVPVAAAAAPIETGQQGEPAFSVQGIGRISCERFLQERQNETNLYWNIGGWIDGFLTAYNAYVPETYDITAYAPRNSADSFSILVARYCSDNGADPVGLVVKSIAEQLHPIRLKTRSDIKEIKVGDEKIEIYEKTIKMAQRNLKKIGYYTGDLDGVFGAETQSALAQFQESEGITATGAPNQDTLLRLLFKSVAQKLEKN